MKFFKLLNWMICLTRIKSPTAVHFRVFNTFLQLKTDSRLLFPGCILTGVYSLFVTWKTKLAVTAVHFLAKVLLFL